MNIPQYKGQDLPQVLQRQFYTIDDEIFIRTTLPTGKQGDGYRLFTLVALIILVVLGAIFLPMELYGAFQHGLHSIRMVLPALLIIGIWTMLFHLFHGNRHLGTLEVDGTTRIWPKYGVYCFYKEDGTLLRYVPFALALLVFAILLHWIFIMLIVISIAAALFSGYSLKIPPPWILNLSQPHYFFGDTLRFTIKSETTPENRYVQFYNVETITLGGESSSERSRVLYYDWCYLEAGNNEVCFQIPDIGVVDTNFSKYYSTGWMVSIHSERPSVYDFPYMMPIFES